MRTSMLLRSMSLAVALAAASPLIAGCDSKEADITAENIDDQGAVTEKHDTGEVVWTVAPEGQVKALVRGPDGKPLEKGVSGTLTVKAAGDAEAVPVTVPIVPDPKTGLLVAVIPKLDADMTEVKYELKGDAKPMKGALHLPPGGTNELALNAKAAAEIKVPEGKKGPNGGVIQVVGDDTIEVVADKGSGKVRVYFLDPDLKPVKIVPEKEVKIAVVTNNGPEVIILKPDPGGVYFAGKLNVVVNPVKLTVAVKHNNVSKVVVVGWQPSTVIVVGASAPAAVYVVNTGWDVDVKVGVKPVVVIHDDDDDDDHHHHHKGKGKVHIKGKGVHIKIK